MKIGWWLVEGICLFFVIIMVFVFGHSASIEKNYISTENEKFQPMNANFGILAEGFAEIRDKKLKKKFLAERALEEIRAFRAQLAEEKE